MKMTKPRILFATLAVALPGLCLAQVPAGLYVGVSAGQSSTSFESQDYTFGPGASDSQDETDSAYKLFAGYNFNRNWAVEAGYADLGKPSYTTRLFGVTGVATVENTAWFVAGKGTLPVGTALGLFAKLGVTQNKSEATGSVGALSVSGSKTRTEALVGVGAQYSLTRNFGIRAEYEDFGKFGNSNDTGRTKTSLWSVGVTYSF
jgi:OOP family OmpA-OmpF porin